MEMKKTIEKIPTWAFGYIFNGDMTGLTDEEGTVTAYPQAVNKLVIHQLLAVRQFFNAPGIDDFLYRITH